MAVGTKAPWHLWVVGVLGLLWNGFGALDFALSVTMGEAWYRIAKMTEAQIDYIQSYPLWTYFIWFAGAWGAIIGTVLLLFRSRWAVHAYAVSLIGFLLSLVYTYVLSDGQAVMGGMNAMHALILAGCLFFLWYAWTMAKRGVLR